MFKTRISLPPKDIPPRSRPGFRLFSATNFRIPLRTICTSKLPVNVTTKKNYQASFTNLLSFVKKNITIPGFLASIPQDSLHSQQLLKAINQCKLSDEIFKHQHSYLHLLDLIKKNKCKFATGMTIYAYHTALMQFTSEGPPIKEHDMDVKDAREVKVIRLVKDNSLSDAGEVYVRALITRYKNLKIEINDKELKEFILSLPTSDQILINIQHKSNLRNDTDRMAGILMHNVPFFVPDNESFFSFNHYSVPSYPLLEFVLQKTTYNTITMLPAFGTVGRETLRDLHRNGCHPVSLYASDIASNPKDADKFRCGPLLIWMHDIAHTFWGSLLSKHEHDIINYHVYPLLENMYAEAVANHDQAVADKIRDIIDNVYDYNLTPARDYLDEKTRLANYLTRCFAKLSPQRDRHLFSDSTSSPYAKLGDSINDRVFYLLCKHYYSHSVNTDGKEVVFAVIQNTRTQAIQKRDRSEMTLDNLENLAKLATNHSVRRKDITSQLTGDEWKALFQNVLTEIQNETNPQKICKTIYEHPLLAARLINEFGFSSFNPYQQLTTADCAKLRDWLILKTTENTAKLRY